MGDLTLILIDGTEVPIAQGTGISVSVHNEKYARVHIEIEGNEDDCIINEGECWPLEAEISRLTGIKEVDHYPNRKEQF